jgi:general nucleoside transport system permease protein
MHETASTPSPVFKPGLMQWIIGAILLVAGLVPILVEGLSPLRIVLLAIFVAGWAAWVWFQPEGGRALMVPLLAVVSALLVGAVVIVLAGSARLPLADRLLLAVKGYAALVDGAFLKTGAFSETLVAATPLILTGLAVALGFRAGLFNIGAEGQYLIGAVFGVYVGYAIPLPPILHAVVALVAGAIGGALWGVIPGILKAKLGAHEVINTIMMNFIAAQLTDWLVHGPMKDPSGPSTIRTPTILTTAYIARFSELFPTLFNPADRLNLGLILALLAAVGVWWLLWKTTIGFEMRTSGLNLDAARYAGIKAGRTIILTMALSGALAGLAGTIEVQGLNRNLPAFFSAGYGFDAIAIALLGGNHPFGVVLSAVLFASLSTGSDVLQIRTGVSHYLVSIIQALILLFVAAPAMIRWFYHLKARETDVDEIQMTRGWGG